MYTCVSHCRTCTCINSSGFCVKVCAGNSLKSPPSFTLNWYPLWPLGCLLDKELLQAMGMLGPQASVCFTSSLSRRASSYLGLFVPVPPFVHKLSLWKSYIMRNYSVHDRYAKSVSTQHVSGIKEIAIFLWLLEKERRKKPCALFSF